MNADRQSPLAFSLRWKILAWFFVNLAVIGFAIFYFLRGQFRVGIDSLLAGPTGARLDAIAQPLGSELRALPEAEWSAALGRATAQWRARGVKAALVRNDGRFVTGDIAAVPAEVKRAVDAYDSRRRNSAPGRFGGRPPSRGDGPPPEPPDWDFGRRKPPPDREFGRIVPAIPAPVSAGGLEKFMLVAGSPQRYWAGVHLDSAPGAAPFSATLLFASDSLRGGGLFFDYTPWLWLGGGLVVLSVLLWLPFVHRLTSALGRLTQSAEAIAQGRFDPPPATARRDEIGRLNRAHRHMAARLEGFVAGQKRFLGDTAHELLSPLARLEVALSILEQRAADADRAYSERALGEVRHISTLVHDLLSFTKAGLRGKNVELQPAHLATLVREVIAREAADARVEMEIGDDLRVLAEPELLARALGNIIRNAVRYAGDAGPIRIAAAPHADGIVLTVTDEGPGVPPESLDRLFDPFFRPDVSRTGETGGTGLGLAIVKSCVEACGGSVAVRNREPRGLQVELLLHR